MKEFSSKDLVIFESEIAELFNSGKIQAPIHLSDGNEQALVDVFANINSGDWVFGSWRSHYQCLLKGVPKDKLKSAILAGKSISLCFPEHKVFSSAIVGGQLPIAVGVALSIKRNSDDKRVWCFLGDMTSETGIAQTCIYYALRNELPITFIVEDNSLSVLTDTRVVWGTSTLRYEEYKLPNLVSYKYKSKYPHAGAGTRVQF
jgi:pyruvate dehydrogenase E1 component alpha subunit